MKHITTCIVSYTCLKVGILKIYMRVHKKTNGNKKIINL